MKSSSSSRLTLRSRAVEVAIASMLPMPRDIRIRVVLPRTAMAIRVGTTGAFRSALVATAALTSPSR